MKRKTNTSQEEHLLQLNHTLEHMGTETFKGGKGGKTQKKQQRSAKKGHKLPSLGGAGQLDTDDLNNA